MLATASPISIIANIPLPFFTIPYTGMRMLRSYEVFILLSFEASVPYTSAL